MNLFVLLASSISRHSIKMLTHSLAALIAFFTMIALALTLSDTMKPVKVEKNDQFVVLDHKVAAFDKWMVSS